MSRERVIKMLDEFTAANGVSGDEGAVATLLEKLNFQRDQAITNYSNLKIEYNNSRRLI